MQVSVRTAEKHRPNMMLELNLGDLAGLTRVAVKHDLILLNE